MNRFSSLARTFIVISLSALAWTPLHAVDLYWDSNGATTGAGATPNGTWGVDSFWSTNSTGGAGTFSTSMTAADAGFFSAGTDAINPYTVTVSGTQASGNLTFQDGTPTLTGGTIALGANKTLTAVTTLNGTATIASALTVNTTAGGTTTFTLTANNGPANTDLLLTGPISATSANVYQLRLSGTGDGRIEGAISGHGGLITGAGTWSGNWTIAGNQNLGSTGFTLSAANNKLIMGDSLSDVQSWSGTTTISTPSALMTVKSAATTGLLFLRGAGGTLDVHGSIVSTALTFGINATTTDASQYGVLKLSGGNATFSGTGGNITIYGTGSKIIGGAASYGTLTMNQTSALTLTGNVTLGGAGTNENNFNLVKAGTHTLTLSGANTFNGSTTINAGTLSLANQNAIQNSTLVMTGGGNVSFSSAEVANAFTLGGLSASSAGSGYNIALTNNASTAIALTVGTNNASTTYASVLSGSGSLVKTGTGALTLSGNNSYSGTTTISAGTLLINAGGRLGSGSYAADITNNGALVYAGTNNQTLSGILSGSGSLTHNASSLLTLSGNNSYSGTTTISAGAVNIQNANALGSTAAGTTVSSGAALQLQGGISLGAEALTLSGTGVSADGALRNISGANSLSGDITLNAATRINSDSGSLTLSGGISGTQNLTIGGSGNTTLAGSIATSTGTLTKDGSGTLTLSGASSFTGAVTIQNGALQLDGGDNRLLANKTITIGSVSNSAKLILGGASSVNQTLANISLSGLGGSVVGGSSSASSLHFNSATNLTLNGTVFGGAGLNENNLALVKSGGGSLTLNGTNTYTGGTTLTNSSVELLADGAIGTGNLTFNATATTRLRLNGTNQTITGLTILGSTTSVIENQGGGNGTLTIQIANGQTNSSASNLSIRDQFAGTGTLALVKTGEGTLDFSTYNQMAYSGGLTVNEGTLAYTTTAALGSGSLVLGGGTLSYVGNSTVTVSKNITLSDATSSTLNNAAGTVTYNGVISGTGSLTKTGSETLTLSANNTYTGATTINAGTISISNAEALGSTSGVFLANATALSYTGAAANLTRYLSVTSGTATIRNTGGGMLTLSGGLNKNGTTLTFDTGSFNITEAITGTSANSDLVVDAANVTLSASNTYNGPTRIIDGGTLTANVTNALPTANGRTAVSIDATGTGGSTLVLGASQSIASLTGAISSNVTLGSNTLTVGTTSGNTTHAGRISGGSSSALVKDGASTQVLSGNNTGFSGSTTINSGTLQAAAANAVGGSTVIDVNGGSFLVTAANAVNDNAAINLNGGTFAVNGTFDETVGLLTLNANSVIDLSSFTGTLRFGGVGSWAAETSLAIWNWNGINQYGNPVGDGANNRHVVFTNNSGLSNYLDRISFYSDSGSSFVGNAFEVGFSGGGTEIIAVPEPETYLAATALLVGLGIHLLRQRKRHPRLGFEKRLET